MSRFAVCLLDLMRLGEVHKLLSTMRSLVNTAQLGSIWKEPQQKRYALNQIAAELGVLRVAAKAAGLNMSALWIDRMAKLTELQQTGALIDFGGLERGMATMATTMEDELSTRVYLELEPAEAECWSRLRAFGDGVSQKFPSTDYELEEQSKCFAVGRYTASVFHLMRVLEIGIVALARAIGADPDQRNWEQVLQGIDGKLKELRNDQNKPADWKEVEQFYSEASAHFRNLKNAWRNYTMHIHATYDSERAADIFSHVRAFMKNLSTRVQE